MKTEIEGAASKDRFVRNPVIGVFYQCQLWIKAAVYALTC